MYIYQDSNDINDPYRKYAINIQSLTKKGKQEFLGNKYIGAKHNNSMIAAYKNKLSLNSNDYLDSDILSQSPYRMNFDYKNDFYNQMNNDKSFKKITDRYNVLKEKKEKSKVINKRKFKKSLPSIHIDINENLNSKYQ